MKKGKSLIALLLSVFLLGTCINYNVREVKADPGSVSARIDALRSKFPSGKYWNHPRGTKSNPDGYTNTPCNHHGDCTKGSVDFSGSCGCNSFMNSAIQCQGFVCKLGYDTFGSNPYTSWTKYNNRSALDNVMPGDIIRYKSNTHSIFVTAVSGDQITYADCNNTGPCKIRWDGKISKSQITGFTYVWHAKNYGDVAPEPGLSTDSSFLTPLKCYSISTDRVTTYSSVGGSSTGYISGGQDECTVNAVYTNGWVQVTYPVSNGTKTAYCELSNFINAGVGHYGLSVAANTTIYSRSDLSNAYGVAYPSDNITVVGDSGNALQVIYPVSGGYKMGWMEKQGGSSGDLQTDSQFPTPLKLYTRFAGRVTTYKSVNGATSGYISGDTDLCTIEEVYTNGWVKVNYPVSKGTKTAYCELGEFLGWSVSHYSVQVLSNTKAYRRKDLAEPLGDIYPEDAIKVVAKEGESLQVIYPISGGYKMGWIPESAATVLQADNIGTDFYGLIINIPTWRMLTVDERNVVSCKERYNASQVWHFERRDGNLYRITSMLNGLALDVYGAVSTPNANVGVYEVNDSTAQQWKIDVQDNGTHYLTATCAGTCVMDLTNGSAEENTNIEIYPFHGQEAQSFTVYKVNPIEALSASKESISLSTQEVYSFKNDITISPQNVYNSYLAYTSDNESVAAVDSEGNVSGISPGHAVITARSKDGLNKEVQLQVEVKDIPITSIVLPAESLDLTVGCKMPIGATTLPENAGYQELKYTSSDEKIAQADKNGTLTLKGEGDAVITVTTADNSCEASLKVHVNPMLKGDVTGDSKLTQDDVEAMQGYIVGMTEICFNESAGDLNEDGQINIVDLSLLIKLVQNQPEEPDKPDDNPSPPPTPDQPGDEVKDTAISAKEIIAQKGKTVEVPVMIEKNQGLMGFALDVKYDADVLKNPQIKPAALTEKGSLNDSITEETNGQFKVLWNYSEDVKEDGELFLMTFETASEAPDGEYQIALSLSDDDTFNQEYQNAAINCVGGKVIIQEQPSFILGDVNSDTSINNKDVAMISRYLVGREELEDLQKQAADVNKDSAVNNKDAAKLSRYLVGKETLE